MTSSTPSIKSPLKVGYVLKRYPRFSETFIVNGILALEAMGIEVVVFALRPALEGCFHEKLARVRARVEYLPQAGQKSAQLLAALKAARTQQRFKFDLDAALAADAAELEQALIVSRLAIELGVQRLHAHFATSAASVARLVKRFTGIPYSVTAHAKDIFHDSVDQQALFERLRDAQSVVTVSDFNVRYLCDRWPELAHRVKRIYNGMDLSLLHRTPYVGRSPRLLAVGRLVPKKGFDLLLQALPLILERCPELHVDIVGDGVLREELVAQSAALNLTGSVHFHGALSQERVFELLRGARVFAAPCVVSADGDRDGLPTVLLEAMAMGTPCVATPVTGIPEAIAHETTGLLVEPGNVAELAEACCELLLNPERAAALAGAARDHLEQQFDISQTVPQLAALWANEPATLSLPYAEVI